MQKLPISIGILSWHSGQVLVDTLTTYHNNGLFDIVNDVTILFQEATTQDVEIARHFGLDFIALQSNIGIGKGFIRLTENAQSDYALVLEHDWNLIENFITTFGRLQSGITLLQDGYECIRYRHRQSPGFPHFSFRHQGNELNYYDEEIGCTSPHLLDAVHWTEHPDIAFGPMIQKQRDYYVTTSRYGNWTNNPCLYRRDFYIETVSQFSGDGIALEGNISKWWAQQSFKVAHGEGLFMHKDLKKYGQ